VRVITPQLLGAAGMGLVALAVVGACGGKSTREISPSACEWPESFDPPDATSGECQSARFHLWCQGTTGGGMGCLSDDPARCPEQDALPGVNYPNCQSQCHSNEYAVRCGGIGPEPGPQPPSQCRTLPQSPGGTQFACCPCVMTLED